MLQRVVKDERTDRGKRRAVKAADPSARAHQPASSTAEGAREGEVGARGALFEGFFLGGFECSCQLLEDGRRLDLTASTRHVEWAEQDFARARQVGFTACRDGASWVATEPTPGRHDFRPLLPLLRAAERHGVQVIWDLMHFGWPPDVDVFSPAFPGRLARHAEAFAHWLREESDQPGMITPVNEISFVAWAGGDVRCLNPFAVARGVELKAQLVRATIEAMDAVRAVMPNARFLQPEPVINIVAGEHPRTWRRVESDNLLQYQAWGMLVGEVWPRLGGHPRENGLWDYADDQGQRAIDVPLSNELARQTPRMSAARAALLEAEPRVDRQRALGHRCGPHTPA